MGPQRGGGGSANAGGGGGSSFGVAGATDVTSGTNAADDGSVIITHDPTTDSCSGPVGPDGPTVPDVVVTDPTFTG